MTEEQKKCGYCHFDVRGQDFGDGEDGCYFKMAKSPYGYDINVWGKDFDVVSDYINYCPMCGRKLPKEA